MNIQLGLALLLSVTVFFIVLPREIEQYDDLCFASQNNHRSDNSTERALANLRRVDWSEEFGPNVFNIIKRLNLLGLRHELRILQATNSDKFNGLLLFVAAAKDDQSAISYFIEECGASPSVEYFQNQAERSE